MRSFFTLIWSWLKGLYRKIFKKDGSQDDPTYEIPFDGRPEGPDPGEIICYYGCPNSKKAQKLQLSKKLYR